VRGYSGPGRPGRARACAPLSADIEARIAALRKGGMGMLRIARELGIGTSTVQRVVSATL